LDWTKHEKRDKHVTFIVYVQRTEVCIKKRIHPISKIAKSRMALSSSLPCISKHCVDFRGWCLKLNLEKRVKHLLLCLSKNENEPFLKMKNLPLYMD